MSGASLGDVWCQAALIPPWLLGLHPSGRGASASTLVAARAKLEDGRMLCLHKVLHTLMASLDPSELSVLDCPAEGAGAGFLDILKLTG